MPDDESIALLGDVLLLKMADKVTLCFILLVKKKYKKCRTCWPESIPGMKFSAVFYHPL